VILANSDFCACFFVACMCACAHTLACFCICVHSMSHLCPQYDFQSTECSQ
jgi:hypothetical protein